MDEQEHIRQRYERRKQHPSERYSMENPYVQRVVVERQTAYANVLYKYFKDPKEVKVLEVGAGAGFNLHFFLQAGVPPEQLYANELLEDRIALLRKAFPGINVLPGDARAIAETDFDLIFQSTVLSSILDESFRKELCANLWGKLKLGGIFLSYDFAFNNPRNPDVAKVTVAQLKEYFPQGTIEVVKKVTLAPPIGRRVGKGYGFFNTFPFLRSHRVVVIRK